MILIIDRRTGLVSGYSDGVPQVDERYFEVVEKELTELEDVAIKQNDMVRVDKGKLEITKRPHIKSKSETLNELKEVLSDTKKDQEVKNQAIIEIINALI